MNNTLHNRQFPLGITHNDDKLIVITSQGTHYATTYDPSAARLIFAAPDLLEALVMLEKASRKALDTSATHDGLENCKILLMARIAIEKANGKTL